MSAFTVTTAADRTTIRCRCGWEATWRGEEPVICKTGVRGRLGEGS